MYKNRKNIDKITYNYIFNCAPHLSLPLRCGVRPPLRARRAQLIEQHVRAVRLLEREIHELVRHRIVCFALKFTRKLELVLSTNSTARRCVARISHFLNEKIVAKTLICHYIAPVRLLPLIFFYLIILNQDINSWALFAEKYCSCVY